MSLSSTAQGQASGRVAVARGHLARSLGGSTALHALALAGMIAGVRAWPATAPESGSQTQLRTAAANLGDEWPEELREPLAVEVERPNFEPEFVQPAADPAAGVDFEFMPLVVPDPVEWRFADSIAWSALPLDSLVTKSTVDVLTHGAAPDPEPEVVPPEALPAEPLSSEPVQPAQPATGTVLQDPVPTHTPAPNYPSRAQRMRREGSVLCRLLVTEDGVVSDVFVVESSGFDELDRAAREGLKAWRFEAGREGEREVAGSFEHRVTFRLSQK